SAMVFLELAWFAIYLVDYLRPTRSQRRRLGWNRVEPFVVDSRLPRLLRMPIQDVSPRWQLGWFLAIACLPGLFLLALPAFLPAVRPSSDPRVVEWTWLAWSWEWRSHRFSCSPGRSHSSSASFERGLANPWHPTHRVRFSSRAYCCGYWDRSMWRP